MKFISHRGNLNGKDLNRENKIFAIEECLNLGIDVEIDIRYLNNKFYLGHDDTECEVSLTWLLTPGLWVHSKTIETFSKLLNYVDINTFFHQTDDCTLTTFGWIWVYPGKPIINKFCIAVLPETIKNYDIKQAGGVCSDNILNYYRI